MVMGFTQRRAFFLLASAAAAAVSVFALFLLNFLRAEYRAYNISLRESAALRAAAEGGEEALARAKSLLTHGAPLPPRAESANRFYSALLEALSAEGLSEVRVLSSAFRDGEMLFLLSGRAEYAHLREFLFSLRKFPYLTRLSKLSMNGSADGEVEFTAELALFAIKENGDGK